MIPLRAVSPAEASFELPCRFLCLLMSQVWRRPGTKADSRQRGGQGGGAAGAGGAELEGHEQDGGRSSQQAALRPRTTALHSNHDMQPALVTHTHTHDD